MANEPLEREDIGGYGTHNIRDKVGQVGEDLRDLASTATEAAREQLRSARDMATEYYERGVDSAYSMEQALENYIREKPIQSALIAVGCGFLLGAILRRR